MFWMRRERAAPSSASTLSQARTKAALSCATSTAWPYSEITSRIAVLTTGFSPAMYSSVLVGLMKRVDSFNANGIRPTSQPARKYGKRS